MLADLHDSFCTLKPIKLGMGTVKISKTVSVPVVYFVVHLSFSDQLIENENKRICDTLYIDFFLANTLVCAYATEVQRFIFPHCRLLASALR